MEFIRVIVIIYIILVLFVVYMLSVYKKLNKEVLKELGYSSWNIIPYIDEKVRVKSRQSLEKYNDIKFFKDNKDRFDYVKK